MPQTVFSLHVNDLKKTFKSITALDGITMHFASGLMHGIIGPEGAGKSTLMRIILGLLKPTSGSVEFSANGIVVDYATVRAHVAYMPQQQSLYADLSIGEHLNFFKELYGITQDAYQTKRDELLNITRLAEFVDRPAGALSGGMYKKLGLMCALLRSPRIILLDEPTNGVDPISRREFWELLYKLADQQILILLTTAYMDEAERCGNVNLIEHGKIIAAGEPRALLQEAQVKNFDALFIQRANYSHSIGNKA